MDQQGQEGQFLENGAEQTIRNPRQAPMLTSALITPLPEIERAGVPVISEQPVAHLQIQQNLETNMRQRFRNFWNNQNKDVKNINEFKSHCLPLARIKKIMRADEDVKMISTEAPIVFAKACEMFILDLTLRSWYNTEENKRRTLQKADVTTAITRTEIFDFLLDVVPKEEVKNEPLYAMPRNAPLAVGDSSQGYINLPPQQQLGHDPRIPEENINLNVVDPDLYRRHIPYEPPVLWYQQAQEHQLEQESGEQQELPQSRTGS